MGVQIHRLGHSAWRLFLSLPVRFLFPTSSHRRPKTCRIVGVHMSVHGCLSLCISPVIEWPAVQGVPFPPPHDTPWHPMGYATHLQLDKCLRNWMDGHIWYFTAHHLQSNFSGMFLSFVVTFSSSAPCYPPFLFWIICQSFFIYFWCPNFSWLAAQRVSQRKWYSERPWIHPEACSLLPGFHLFRVPQTLSFQFL